MAGDAGGGQDWWGLLYLFLAGVVTVAVDMVRRMSVRISRLLDESVEHHPHRRSDDCEGEVHEHCRDEDCHPHPHHHHRRRHDEEDYESEESA